MRLHSLRNARKLLRVGSFGEPSGPSGPSVLRRTLFFRKKERGSKLSKSFQLRRVTPEECSSVVQFCNEHLFREEPLFIATGLNNGQAPYFEHQLWDVLRQGTSLMIECRSKCDVVGVAINCLNSAWDAEKLRQQALCCKCPSTAQLLRLHAFLYETPDLFNVYSVDTIFETKYLAVRKHDQCRGVGTELLRRSRESCADLGYPIYKVSSTSLYSDRICNKLKMHLVYNLPYSQYCYPSGKQILYPPPPHKEANIFIDFPRHPAFDKSCHRSGLKFYYS